MAKDKFEVGDEVMVRGAVTAVWPDGQVTILIASAGHKVTLTARHRRAEGAPAPKLSGNPSGFRPRRPRAPPEG